MSSIWKFGDDVDTDQMVPGRYAPYMRPNEDVGTAAFIEARPDFNQQAQVGDIIVAGHNFGCGSSREYAPLALKRRGVSAIIAKGFARIFYRNAINLGIPLFVAPEIVDQLAQDQEAQFSLEHSQLILENETLQLPELPPFAQAIINAGGVVAYVREHGRFPEANQTVEEVC